MFAENGRGGSSLFVNSVAKALAVLMVFGNDRRSMSLPEVAEATGIGKSAAQRFAFTLEALGYLRKDPVSRRYRVSPRILEFGVRYVPADELVEYATPFLSELNRHCMETVNLSRPDGWTWRVWRASQDTGKSCNLGVPSAVGGAHARVS
jgi:IclR family pca regulon transcriptional regulator